MSAFANSVDPDQLASEEANWSGSALFAIKFVNLYQQSGSKKPTDLDLHCLPLSLWIYINNQDQIIWLAEN